MTARQKRPYASELRLRHAEQTRMRVVTAAADLFARRGYAAATMPMIAELAGVSTETVQAYGPKPRLLRAAVDLVSFGGGRDQPVIETEMGQQLLAARTPLEAAAAAAEILTAANQAAHGVWLAFTEAARHDDVIAAELQMLISSVRVQNEQVLAAWRQLGWLRDDAPFDELVDRATMIGAVELYDRYVRLGEGTVERYRELVVGLLMTSVLRVGHDQQGRPG